MLRRSPERRAAAKLRRHYRVAVWSRLDRGGLGLFGAASAILLLLVGLSSGDLSNAAYAVGIAGAFTAWFLRQGEVVRLGPRGLSVVRNWSTKEPEALFIRLGVIAGFEVRDWYASIEEAEEQRSGAQRSRVRHLLEPPQRVISVRMHDGSYVEVFGRGPLWGRPVLLERRARRPFSHIARTRDGRRMVWTAATDEEVAELLNLRLGEITAALGDAHERIQPRLDALFSGVDFRYDHHRRDPVVRASARGSYSESATGVDIPVLDPLPEPVPPAPPARPVPPRASRDGLAAPTARGAAIVGLKAAPTDLAVPTRYWTLAALRAGSLVGHRPSMLIDADGITFGRPLRRDVRIPIGQIDRFDLEFDAYADPAEIDLHRDLPGRWLLVAVLADGSTVPLTALVHGGFKGNRLFWSAGTDAAFDRPAGSMPWPDDQPFDVATRLTAHVEAARAASDGKRAA